MNNKTKAQLLAELRVVREMNGNQRSTIEGMQQELRSSTQRCNELNRTIEELRRDLSGTSKNFVESCGEVSKLRDQVKELEDERNKMAWLLVSATMTMEKKMRGMQEVVEQHAKRIGELVAQLENLTGQPKP